MKSMCQEARRNSPSVADCRPTSRCIATTSRVASSSTARSSSSGMRPAAWSSRAWSSRRGRSRLPTWSARNGGVVRPMEPPPTTAKAYQRVKNRVWTSTVWATSAAATAGRPEGDAADVGRMLADADPTVGYDLAIMGALVVFLLLALALTGCSYRQDGEPASQRPVGPPPSTMATAGVTSTSGTTSRQPDRRPAGLPGMPPVLDPDDVYAATRPGQLSEVVRRFPARVYVPNSASNTVDVIDARTFKRVRRFPVGRQPQHVTPSWDLRTLWVGNNLGNSLTAIDPATGRRGRTTWPPPTTCTSPPTAGARSSSPRPSAAWTSATPARCGCATACACHAAASITWTSAPTGAACWRAASSAATWSTSTWRGSGS